MALDVSITTVFLQLTSSPGSSGMTERLLKAFLALLWPPLKLGYCARCERLDFSNACSQLSCALRRERCKVLLMTHDRATGTEALRVFWYRTIGSQQPGGTFSGVDNPCVGTLRNQLFKGMSALYARQVAAWTSFLAADAKFKGMAREITGKVQLDALALVTVACCGKLLAAQVCLHAARGTFALPAHGVPGAFRELQLVL